jgi:hypothetical protein
MNLAQTLPEGMMGYYSREKAHQRLVEMTGQDFGYDVEAWKQWFKENRRKKK